MIYIDTKDEINKLWEEFNKIESIIEMNLSSLDMGNYIEKLKKMGYNYLPLTPTLSNTDNQENIEKLLKVLKKNFAGIYVFEEINGNILNQNSWEKHFNKIELDIQKENTHTKNITIRMPKWKQKVEKTQVLYVGRSNNLTKRLTEHIYGISKKQKIVKTSCLRLKSFMEVNNAFKYRVNIFYKEKSPEYNPGVDRLIESLLHTGLKPLLGSSRT